MVLTVRARVLDLMKYSLEFVLDAQVRKTKSGFYKSWCHFQFLGYSTRTVFIRGSHFALEKGCIQISKVAMKNANTALYFCSKKNKCKLLEVLVHACTFIQR